MICVLCGTGRAEWVRVWSFDDAETSSAAQDDGDPP
jgi:hypothetical protein